MTYFAFDGPLPTLPALPTSICKEYLLAALGPGTAFMAASAG